MGKVIYMENTIKVMKGSIAKKLIDEGEIINAEEVNYLVKKEKSIDTVRKSLDGKPLKELSTPMALVVNTRVPSKWILQDTETGEIYRGTTKTTIGEQWEKIMTIDEKM